MTNLPPPDFFLPNWLISLFGALLAACFGSFANMVIYRWPRELNWNGRSFCPNCQATLPAYALFPLFSYLILRGRCANCRQPISIRYFWIEFFCAALGALIGWFYATDPVSAFLLILLATTLLILIGIDLSHRIIPDALNGFIGFLGLLWQLWQNQSDLVGMWPALLTGFILFATSYGLAWGFAKLRGKDGLGGGDIKFLTAAGLWLTPTLIPWLLGLAGLIGIPMGLIWPKLFPNDAEPGFPFGPALAISLFLCIWFAQSLGAVFQIQ